MTEQGEVLSAKYALAPVAHRELELSAGATLSTGAVRESGRQEQFEAILSEMARESAALYRRVVAQTPEFVAFFEAITPVHEISRLRLGSRPAKRSRAGGLEDLRAIPWVFSWTQARVVLPAWLGLGTALAGARQRHGIEMLREMADRWPFFSTLLANAEMGCAKADLAIARRYTDLWDEAATRERIFVRWRKSSSARSRSSSPCAAASACSTATPCCRRRSIDATRSWIRSRSSRSSSCGACGSTPTDRPSSSGASAC